MTLVAIYGPNEDNPEFFKRLLFNLNQGLCSQNTAISLMYSTERDIP
jgi:hypothetical protein